MAGLNLSGTVNPVQTLSGSLYAVPGETGGGTISVKDDGDGNVEITEAPSGWTVADDGNGNVVIGG